MAVIECSAQNLRSIYVGTEHEELPQVTNGHITLHVGPNEVPDTIAIALKKVFGKSNVGLDFSKVADPENGLSQEEMEELEAAKAKAEAEVEAKAEARRKRQSTKKAKEEDK